jgi:hypothetical protein
MPTPYLQGKTQRFRLDGPEACEKAFKRLAKQWRKCHTSGAGYSPTLCEAYMHDLDLVLDAHAALTQPREVSV